MIRRLHEAEGATVLPERAVSGYYWVMQVATGTVVNGKIVVEGVSLTEGAVVAVVTRGADESFSLTETQENELLAAMAEIERGEYVTLEELCSRCRSTAEHGISDQDFRSSSDCIERAEPGPGLLTRRGLRRFRVGYAGDGVSVPSVSRGLPVPTLAARKTCGVSGSAGNWSKPFRSSSPTG